MRCPFIMFWGKASRAGVCDVVGATWDVFSIPSARVDAATTASGGF